MSSTRTLRRWLTTGALLVTMFVAGALTAGAATANTVWAPVAQPADPTTAPAAPTPMVLASTGLDIVWPVVLGLAFLLLGTVAVGAAFLSTGRRGQHR